MTRAVWITAMWLLVQSSVFAQSVDGRWTTGLRAHGPDGPVITFTLKSDGDELSGTLHGIRPMPMEGSIEGDVLKIRIRVATASGGELFVNYIAILEDDQLEFTHQSETGRPPVFGPAARKFTAQRVD